MKLQPTLKQKKRYVVFEINIEVDEKDLKLAIRSALNQFFGDLGNARAAPMFVKSKNNKFIIKVNHKHVDELKVAIALIKTIKNSKVIIRSIITSGTIKKASEYI